jgi:hypothetical protein
MNNIIQLYSNLYEHYYSLLNLKAQPCNPQACFNYFQPEMLEKAHCSVYLLDHSTTIELKA